MPSSKDEPKELVEIGENGEVRLIEQQQRVIEP
jgi:hypothetical protein